ncbi:MAG TPA: histidine--tRNA ligase, partial [Firmicutes bacterium]|nr:histidine--tRNA ligase [Bacillota bacterium]
ALQEAPLIADYLCPDCREHFGEVKSLLDVLEITYVINPYLVRGFDYYTRTVFEVICPELGSQDAIGAGGRYDGLIEEIGGEPTPAVGFAVGVERLLLALQSQGKFAADEGGPQAYLVHFGGETKVKAAQLALRLRKKGLWVELDYLDRSIRAQMRAANRLQASYVLMLGEEELAKNQVLLRDMASGEEAPYSLEKLEQLINVLGRV